VAIVEFVHPARQIAFADLLSGLQAARADGHVYERPHGDLSLWCYTSRAVYDRAWSPLL
jgi:hypothetical protein